MQQVCGLRGEAMSGHDIKPLAHFDEGHGISEAAGRGERAMHPQGLSIGDMKSASDIAVRYWEARKGWPVEKAVKSLQTEARRLREQSAQVESGSLGGMKGIWQFAADMLDAQALFLKQGAKANRSAS